VPVHLRYRILNVFTDGDNPFSGNPLCVFEDATGLSDKAMQDLARQLNLSADNLHHLQGRGCHSQRPHLHAQLRAAVCWAPHPWHGVRRE